MPFNLISRVCTKKTLEKGIFPKIFRNFAKKPLKDSNKVKGVTNYRNLIGLHTKTGLIFLWTLKLRKGFKGDLLYVVFLWNFVHESHPPPGYS